MVVSSVARKKVWVLPIVLCIAGLMVLPASAVLSQHVGPLAPVSGAASTSAALGRATPASPLAPGLPGSASPAIPGLIGQHLPKLPGLPAAGVHPASPGNASRPSGSTPAPASGLGLANLSAELARINATFAKVPGSAAVADTARLIAEGVVPAQDAYLPNLHLLSEPATSPVTPSYNVSPAPMGLADLGLGASGAYSLSTPGVLGALTLDGYNASAGSLYEDTGAYYWDGLSPNTAVTPWQSGVQLNTVVTNVSYPGSNTGVYWTQNVVDFSGDQLQFIDNVWNFTGPNASMNASTLYTYNGSWIVGDYYYDVGPVLPLTFPLTLDLYNNASNVGGRSTVTFGYRVTEGTTVYTGIYDTVVFNSMPTSGVPLLTPDFLIDGYQPVYTAGPYQGPLYDAELVFGGPGGGSNAVINSLNGSMNLDYLTGTSWSPAPSAYDYGADTGETAIGFAGWWQGSTEYINQGPSILYGLWNTPSGVPSGETQIIWYNSPIYALDFWGPTGVAFDNLSYWPSEPNGTAQTWLPPSTIVGYTAEAFADGFFPVSGILSPSNFGAGATSRWYSFPISAPGFWDAPIYMDGPSQALAMATYATGWSSGPYVFANLAVNVDLTFNHLNDWGFPEFDLFWSYSAGNELVVSNISQGVDSSGGLCSPGGVPATCYLWEPFGYDDLPGYGAEIADWNGSGDVFENLLLEGWTAPIGVEVGGVVSLWNTSDAVAYNISSVDGSFGVWAASSPYLEEVDSSALDAIALTLLDSPDAFADTISAEWFGVDVLDEGGTGGEFVFLDAANYSTAFEGLAANYSLVAYVTADWISTGLSLESTWGLEGVYMTVENGSTGVLGYDLTNVTIGLVSVTTESEGVDLEVTFNTTLAYFDVNGSEGGWLYDAYNPYVVGFDATNGSLGLGIEWGSDLTAVYITATDGSTGLYLEEFGAANVTDVVANDSLGVEVWDDDLTGPNQMVNVTGVEVTNSGTGVEGIFSSELAVYDVQASSGSLLYPSVGVDFVYSANVQVTNASASGFSEAVWVWDSVAVDATNVSATASAYGVELLYSEYVTVTNVSAASGSLVFPTAAVYIYDTYFVEIANVSSSGFAWGVYAEDVYALEVADVTAALGATGVFVLGSYDVVVYDVVAGTGALFYATVGMTVNDSEYVYATNVSADGFAGGVNISESDFVYVINLTATNGALGARITNSSDIFVTNVVVTTSGSTGVGIEDASYIYVDNVTATGATGTVALDSQFLWIANTTVTDVSVFGVVLEGCSYAWVTNTSAASGAFGVAALGSVEVFVGNTQASGVGTVGVAFDGTNDSWVNDTSATSWAIGVALLETVGVHVAHATANDPFLTSPWAYYSVISLPTAAIVTLHTSDTTVSNVATDTYPLALYDDGSSNLFVQDLTAQYGAVGVMLNGTSYALLNGITATWDGTGVQMNAGAYANIVTASDFENDTGYGVDIQDGSSNLVYSNDFAWDNGANGTYNATHVQVFSSSPTNEFNNSAEIGNYWADWHTYVDGVLAPYYISSGAWDYHPLGSPEGMVTVTFDATGLPFGTSWSVTLDHVTKWTVGASIVFDEYPGTYTFTVGAPSAWSASPSGASVIVSTGPVEVPVGFSAIPPTYTVWINETGLASGTSWSAIFNGVSESTTGASLAFTVTAGTYDYQIGSVVGYTASSAGSTVTLGGNYAIAVTYTSTAVPPPAKYTVWINETGLASGTRWSAVFNGVSESTTGTSLAFTVTADTYAYQIGTVADYAASSSGGTATVGGNYTILVTYTSTLVPPPAKHTVWINETGLASDTSWSAIFNGVSESTTGTSLAFTVTAGTYTYQIGSVAGYTASSTGGSATVGGNYAIAVTYTSTAVPPPATYTVWINETGLASATSWSAIFNGVQETTTGTSLAFTVTAGTYDYQIGSVSGYTASSMGSTATVGGNYAIVVTYSSPTSTTTTSSSVPTSTFNTDWAIALGLAALAVIIALVALLRRPPTWAPAPASAWQEPTPQEGGSEGASPQEPGH